MTDSHTITNYARTSCPWPCAADPGSPHKLCPPDPVEPLEDRIQDPGWIQPSLQRRESGEGSPGALGAEEIRLNSAEEQGWGSGRERGSEGSGAVAKCGMCQDYLK